MGRAVVLPLPCPWHHPISHVQRETAMSEKILVVEDNPQNMMVILMTLRQYGYNLLEAVDGEEALQVAERERPDLILIDIQLPKVDGFEVTRRLRQMPAFSSIPIVALTAHAMKGDEERIIGAGCDDYLAKPFSIYELRRVVAEMLSRHQDD